MSALEQEVIEKLRVLTFIENIRADQPQPQMSLAEWLELARQSRAELRAKYGENFRVDIQALLDELREKPTDARLGRR